MKETCYSDTNSVNNSETNSEANTEINREAKKWGQISPLQISPAAFLAAFGPGPYGLRTFCDQGGGGGKNYTLAGADDPALAKLVAELHRVNQ